MRLHHLLARDAVLHLRLALHPGVCRTHTWGTGARASQFVRSPHPECTCALRTHTWWEGAAAHRGIGTSCRTRSSPQHSRPQQPSGCLENALRRVCAAGSRRPRRASSRGEPAPAQCVEPRVSRGGWRGGDSGAHPNLDQPPGWLKSRARRQGRTKPRQDASKWQYPDGARACRMLAVLCVRLAVSRCASIAGT